MCNAFDFGKYGPAILFNGALLNHSCDPNVIFKQENKYMIFKTIKDINKGEELCNNYIDITLPKKRRLSILKSQYGFTCTCNRCK